MEHGALVGRHVADLVAVDADLRHGDSHRRVVDDRTFVVELGLLFLLVDTVGSTRLGKEHVGAEQLLVIVAILDIIEHRLGLALPEAVLRCTVHAHGDVALVVRHEGEAAGLLDRLVRIVAAAGVIVDHRLPFHLELRGVGYCTEFQFIIVLVLLGIQFFQCLIDGCTERFIIAKEVTEVIDGTLQERLSHLRSIFLAFTGKHLSLRCLVVVSRSGVAVGVREGVAERYTVGAYLAA